ncbi:MAG: aminotransferase class III-fold pyridoxal phosphate-dependent enzyme [Rhodoferax sp.]|nr:aminotransferase class III-fold pyridoxal phosphate-dependent enzyme [Rhodoferax sp.]
MQNSAMTRNHELNVQQDLAAVLHPYTPLDKIGQTGPVVMTRGEGVYVYDDQGRRYLEGLAGLWCTSLGFSEERLVEAAARQMAALPYYQLFAGRANEPSIELSDRLIGMTRHLGMDKALFANSGSEANDQAVKVIWYYFNATGRPRKKKLIARERGYHGVTVMAASLTGLPGNHADFDLPISDRVLRTGCPSHYHYARDGESEAQFLDRTVAELEALIEREGADTIAALFAEPMQGAGGVIVPPPGYWERVQAVLRRHDILLVADEVICGFGRLGDLFGCDTYGIRPDIMTVAKALSSAYIPISATLVSGAIYQGLIEGSRRNGVFSHGVTYSGHPVAAAVANETLKLYQERDIVGHVRRVAPRFQQRLQALAAHPLVGQARGVGLVGAVELARDKQRRLPFDPASGILNHAYTAAMELGLIVRPLRDTLAVSPPLIITETQVDELFDKLGQALDRGLDAARGAGLVG